MSLLSNSARSTSSKPNVSNEGPYKYSPLVSKHLEQIEHARNQVWQKQDPIFQYQRLHDEMRIFADQRYPGVNNLHATLDYIFEDLTFAGTRVKARFSIPEKIERLLTHQPCIFSFLPGIGTHESISQYDITLSDRTSQVGSRSHVSVETQITSDPRTKMDFFMVNAPMRAVVDPAFAQLMVEKGMIVIYHRFNRPLNANDCDLDPEDRVNNPSGKHPTVQSASEARSERLHLAKQFGSKMFMAIGVSEDEVEFGKELLKAGALGVCIDVALANSYQAAAAQIEIKQFIVSEYLRSQSMIGNVDTAEGYGLSAECGADVVKVGIGPGSFCTTRLKTAAGKGQGSALMNVSRAKLVYGKSAPTFIADGGIEGPADAIRAIALGAVCAMAGKAYTKCSDGGALKRVFDGQIKAFSHGEASKTAQIYTRGGVKKGYAVEGKEGWVSVDYSFAELINDFSGAARNSLPYYNSRSFAELRDKFSIQQQFADLILGGETGLSQASTGIAREAGTRIA